MDMFGFPVFPAGLLRMALTAIGYIRMQGGHGILIIHGAGHPFTMVAGFMIPGTVGFGFRIMNGAPDGLPGEDLKIITDGRQ